MRIRLLLLIHAVVAPAAAIHATTDVTVQHASSVVSKAEAKAKAAPDNSVLTGPAATDRNRHDQIVRSLAAGRRGRGAANNRRLQEDSEPEKKNEIFHAENDAAAKTRAHLAKIAEMESKKRVREGRDDAGDASDVEMDEKEASIRSNDDEAYKAAKAEKLEGIVNDRIGFVEDLNEKDNTGTKDLFQPEPATKTKAAPTLKSTETMLPDTIKTVRSQEMSEPDSSHGGIRSMTPGGKWGMSIAFISLLALIFINVNQTRSRRGSKAGKYVDVGMNKWEDFPMSYVFCANAGSDVNSETHDDVETMEKMAKEIDDIAKSHLLDDIIDDTLNQTQDTLDLTQDTDAGAEEEGGGGFQGFEIV